LKTRSKQFLGSPPLTFALPALSHFAGISLTKEQKVIYEIVTSCSMRLRMLNFSARFVNSNSVADSAFKASESQFRRRSSSRRLRPIRS